MPGYEEQQMLQQLLSGMNTMQMQAGLMPGGMPALNAGNIYTAPPVMTPGQFSNNLRVQLHQTFTPYPVTPPMFGGITPVPRGYETTPLPGPQMGSGWGMARQQAQNRSTGNLTTVQGLTGFGAELGVSAAVGGVVGTMFGGPIGTAAGIATGAFLGDTINSVAQMPFKPFIDQRNRAMQLQNISMYNVRSGPDLSASGIGLSNAASVDLERNLMRMADSRSFKRDTGNLFNRQDMMKITELSAQVGLLDNAQSVDQMSRDMGKIGRALATFMKVVEEPDVRRALQMMGNMRTMGMGVPEMNVAAQNARVYARMAGTTVQGVMQAGMQGANVFQQYGMSGATGFNIGMGAAGMAGSAATWMDPRQLNMLGGRQGVQDLLTSGAAKMSSYDVFLPGLSKLGPDGKLSIDEEALKGLRSQKGIASLVQRSAQRLMGMGPEGFLNAYSTQAPELKDEFMQKLGPNGALLLPMLHARQLMQQVPNLSMGAALKMVYQGDEKQARAAEVMFKSQDFWDQLNESQRPDRVAAQGVRATERQRQEDLAQSERWSKLTSRFAAPVAGIGIMGASLAAMPLTGGTSVVGAGAGLGIALGGAVDPHAWGRSTNYLSNRMSEFFVEDDAVDTDLEEQRLVAGGGELMRAIRPDRLLSGEQIKMMRKNVATADPNRIKLRDTRIQQLRRRVAMQSSDEDLAFGSDLGFGVENNVFGANSEYLGHTVRRNMGFVERNKARISDLFTSNRDIAKQVNDKSNAQEQFGAEVKRAREAEGTNKSLLALQATGKTLDIKPADMATLVAAGATGVKAFAEDRSSLFVDKETRREDMLAAVKQQLASRGITGDKAAALMKSPDFINEVLRSARRSGDESTRNILGQIEARGEDVRAAREGKAVGLTVTEIAKTRKRALVNLGLFEGHYKADEGQKGLDLFADTSADADIKKRMYAIAALRKNGNPKDDAKAEQMEAELREKLGDEKFNKLQSEVDALTAGLSAETLRASGKQFAKKGAKGNYITDMAIEKATEEAVTAEDATVYSAIQKEFGDDFAKKYYDRDAAGRKQFVKDYVKANPKKFEKYTSEQMKTLLEGDQGIEQFAVDRFKNKTQAVVSGGQAAEPGAPTGSDAISAELVSQLEAWSKQDRARAEAAFSKFERGTENLLEATNAEAGRREVTHTQEVTGKAAAPGSDFNSRAIAWDGNIWSR
jgi:hypothetical protein